MSTRNYIPRSKRVWVRFTSGPHTGHVGYVVGPVRNPGAEHACEVSITTRDNLHVVTVAGHLEQLSEADREQMSA